MAACQNCGADLTVDPRQSVEDDRLDEVVAHIRDGDEPHVLAKTDCYCDPRCFKEVHDEQ